MPYSRSRSKEKQKKRRAYSNEGLVKQAEWKLKGHIIGSGLIRTIKIWESKNYSTEFMTEEIWRKTGVEIRVTSVEKVKERWNQRQEGWLTWMTGGAEENGALFLFSARPEEIKTKLSLLKESVITRGKFHWGEMVEGKLRGKILRIQWILSIAWFSIKNSHYQGLQRLPCLHMIYSLSTQLTTVSFKHFLLVASISPSRDSSAASSLPSSKCSYAQYSILNILVLLSHTL